MWWDRPRGSESESSELAKHPDQRYSPTSNLPSSSWQEQVTPWGLSHGAATTAGRDLPFNQSRNRHPPSFSSFGVEWGGWDPAAHQTLPFLALPLFLDFYRFSPVCQSSPSPRTERGRQELLPGSPTGDLRGNTSSLRLYNMLQSQNRPLNPGLGTLAALQAAQVCTYNRSKAFDDCIKHQG